MGNITSWTGRVEKINGKLMLRIGPDLHAKVATAAEIAGKSINQWAADALGRSV